MESEPLKTPDDLESLLVRSRESDLPNDGFSARVVAALPPPPRRRISSAVVLDWLWIVAGCAIVAFICQLFLATRLPASIENSGAAFARIAAPWLTPDRLIAFAIIAGLLALTTEDEMPPIPERA